MRVYVLHRIEKASDRYHEEGGVVVVAQDEQSARALATAAGCKPTDSEWAEAVVYEVAGDVAPTIYVFPDSGCC